MKPTKEFFKDWDTASKRARELSDERGENYRVLSRDKDGQTEYIVQLTESIVSKILKEAKQEVDFVEALNKIKILQGEYQQKGVDTSISFRQEQSIHLERIYVNNRNEGYGSAFMEALTDICDEYGLICTLSETSEYGSSLERLRKFYKRYGFRINKGRKADHRFWVGMIREPKNTIV